VAGLDKYQIADSVLVELDARAARGDGAPLPAQLADALAGVRRAWRLPMAGLGARAEQALFDELLALAEAWQQQLAQWSAPAPRLRVAWAPQDTSQLIAINVDGISAGGQFDQYFDLPGLEDWIEPLRRADDGRVAL